jgi:hypothetical protein
MVYSSINQDMQLGVPLEAVMGLLSLSDFFVLPILEEKSREAASPQVASGMKRVLKTISRMEQRRRGAMKLEVST